MNASRRKEKSRIDFVHPAEGICTQVRKCMSDRNLKCSETQRSPLNGTASSGENAKPCAPSFPWQNLIFNELHSYPILIFIHFNSV